MALTTMVDFNSISVECKMETLCWSPYYKSQKWRKSDKDHNPQASVFTAYEFEN